jgi:hypothetical protein
MTEVTESGLLLVEGEEVTEIHSSSGETNLDRLRLYLDNWGLELLPGSVFVTVYHNQYPDDGFAIGDVYLDEERAEEVAEEQSDIEIEWEGGYVYERELK